MERKPGNGEKGYGKGEERIEGKDLGKGRKRLGKGEKLQVWME